MWKAFLLQFVWHEKLFDPLFWKIYVRLTGYPGFYFAYQNILLNFSAPSGKLAR